MALLERVRLAYANHQQSTLHLSDGSVLLAVVTSVVGGASSDDVRIKVVTEAPPRERRWLHLSDIVSIG